ncbi:unnamed protein product [marine sediment metagenome]|uniref:Uncharacterized protein n=1 Tax=marine sediment metagenome TaxID=412755 RepID=X0TIS4_9ZZZZ
MGRSWQQWAGSCTVSCPADRQGLTNPRANADAPRVMSSDAEARRQPGVPASREPYAKAVPPDYSNGRVEADPFLGE